jgi:chromosomal replication initiator protein
MQLDRANFETWLRGTVYLRCEDAAAADAPAVFVIGARSPYARDMLEFRLNTMIRRILNDVYGSAADLRYEVHAPAAPPPTADDDMPLMRYLAQHRPAEQPVAIPAALHEQVAPPRRPELPDSALNPRFTFERFVVGSANRTTYAAAQAVAENPAGAYNPLLLYGGVGLGKTHLLQAVAHQCRARGLAAVYVPSEAFVNDLVDSIRQRTTAMFRDKYRKVDVLLVDDIQFLSGKESTQEEFFHTFNALYTHNKQIVLVSDRHPRELVTLEDRLRSRFSGGLIMDIQPPEFETRVAIVESWAQERAVRIPRSVSELMAERARGNIRELEGMFTQIVAQVQLTRQPVTLALAESALALCDRPRQHGRAAVTLAQIVTAVGLHYGLSPKDLTGKRRAARINHARQVAMYVARELTDLSLPQIGAGLGGRSHTTILHGYNKVADLMTEDPLFRQELAALHDSLTQEN